MIGKLSVTCLVQKLETKSEEYKKMINNLNQERKDSLLPPPEILTKYEELGIGEDLIDLIQKEQEHRHNLQKKYLKAYRTGQLFSYLLSLVFLYGIFKLVKLDYVREAYIILSLFTVLIIAVTLIIRFDKKPNSRKNISSNYKTQKPRPRKNITSKR